MIDFFPKEHISCSSKKRFGVCVMFPQPKRKLILQKEKVRTG